MEFEQQAQEDLYARVAMHLRQSFGDLAEPINDDEPDFVVDIGRTRVVVMVHANGPEKASVMLVGGIGDGIAIAPEVALYLLHKAHELPLTTLSVRDDDQIVLRQVILGEAVTRENINMMVQMFAENLAEIDDELTMQFR